jgi:hypothetical protein
MDFERITDDLGVSIFHYLPVESVAKLLITSKTVCRWATRSLLHKRSVIANGTIQIEKLCQICPKIVAFIDASLFSRNVKPYADVLVCGC